VQCYFAGNNNAADSKNAANSKHNTYCLQ